MKDNSKIFAATAQTIDECDRNGSSEKFKNCKGTKKVTENPTNSRHNRKLDFDSKLCICKKYLSNKITVTVNEVVDFVSVCQTKNCE